MLSFIRVVMVMVSLHSNVTLTKTMEHAYNPTPQEVGAEGS